MISRQSLVLCLMWILTSVTNAGEVTVVVNETAGLYRAGFPAGIAFNWHEPVRRDTKFKLVHSGRVLPAQFLPAESGELIRRFQVDFRATLAPYATAEFQIQRSNDGETLPVLKGFELQRLESGMRLSNASYLHWDVGAHLEGILQEFQFEDCDFWDPSQSGLVLKLANGDEIEVSGNEKCEVKALKSGPWSTQLTYSSQALELGLQNIHSNVSLSFDVSRSWVQIDWQVYDPAREVKALAVPMKLKLSEPTREAPTLIDFGTSTQLYSKLLGKQVAVLKGNYFQVAREGQYTWEVFQGVESNMRQLAVGAQQPGSRFQAEGWAHIMDSRKCLALAIDKFGQDSNDLLHLSADGRISLQRTPVGRERLGASKYIHLRFWLHFVFNPQEISAATSPQSMKTPLGIHLK